MTNSIQVYKRRWYVLLTVGIGTFLSSFNTSITNTVLPSIEKELHTTFSQSEWIVLIYLLVLTLFLLPIGRLSDLRGYRRIFLIGFALFACAATLCGLSANYISLVGGRAILGLAGAMILAIGPALISITFPPEQLGRVLGIQAIMTYIGLSLGPVMGGWLTQLWGWKATFFVTVPFALAGLLLGIWAIPQVVMERHKQLDAKGIIFFMIGIASLTLLLNADMIKQQRALIMPLLLILFVGAAWGFLKIERDQPDPTIDIKLFRIRNFAFGTIGAALNYLCFFLALFLLPFYLDHVLHFSAAKIGTYLTLPPIVMTICAPIAGALSDNIGPRALASLGMIFSTAALILFGIMVPMFGIQSSWVLMMGLLLTGMGTGTFAAPNNSAILSAAPRQKQGMASGTLATFRYIGMMAGSTVGGSLFNLLLQFTAQDFLRAFSQVMWVGALFGLIGILCTMAMTNSHLDPAE